MINSRGYTFGSFTSLLGNQNSDIDIEFHNNNFDYLFDRYNNLSLLSDKDKEYVSLYKYIIYIKK